MHSVFLNDTVDFITNERLTDDALLAIKNKYIIGSDSHNLCNNFFKQVLKHGGIRFDVFDTVSKNDFFSFGIKGSIKYFSELLLDRAEKEWFVLIRRSFIEKKSSSIFCAEIIDAFRYGLPVNVVNEYFDICSDAVHMKFAREETMMRLGIEYNLPLVNEALQDISNITKILNNDCKEYQINSEIITEKFNEQQRLINGLYKKAAASETVKTMYQTKYDEVNTKFYDCQNENELLKRKLAELEAIKNERVEDVSTVISDDYPDCNLLSDESDTLSDIQIKETNVEQSETYDNSIVLMNTDEIIINQEVNKETSDIPDNMQQDILQKKHNTLSDNVHDIKENIRGFKNRLYSFTNLYSKLQLQKFKKMDRSQQENIIFLKLLKQKCDPERIKYVKQAIRNGALCENVYMLVSKNPSAEELKEYCENDQSYLLQASLST